MDDEGVKEVVEDTENIPEKVLPIEVKVINSEKPKVSVYDDTEDLEYENLYPTEEQIKEFEDANTT